MKRSRASRPRKGNLEMPFHPFIHFEIARQRQSDVLLRAEQYRLIQEARTVEHDDHGLIEARAVNKRRPPTRTARPQRGKS